MMEMLRRSSQHVLIKGFLGLIAASFVLWGVGDILRSRHVTDVAVVGKTAISPEELTHAVQQEAARLQGMLGIQLTPDQIRSFRLKENVLQQLISARLLAERLTDLHVEVGEAAIRKSLAQDQGFQDESGHFSAQIFRDVLRANNMTETQFLADVQRGLRENILLRNLVVEPVFSTFQVQKLAESRAEKRQLNVLKIPAGAVREPAEPSDTELQQFYQEHLQTFTVPELRTFRYVILDSSTLTGGEKISDQDLKALYEERKDQLAFPERRTVEHLVFESEEQAKSAREALVVSSSKPSHLGKQAVTFDKVTLAELPADIQQPVFALEPGVVSEPVQSSLGWHVFLVTKVEPSGVMPFEQARGELENELKEKYRASAFEALSNEVQDMVAGGKNLLDVAKEKSLKVQTVSALSRDGKNAAGEAVPAFADAEAITPLAFSTDAGRVSALTTLPDYHRAVLVEVESVTSERVKALDEVRGSALTKWREAKIQSAVQELATEISKKAQQQETSLTASARAHGFSLTPYKGMARPDMQAEKQKAKAAAFALPPSFLQDAFSLSLHGVSVPFRTEGGDYLIAEVVGIDSAPANDGEIEKVKNELRSGFANEVLEQYHLYLQGLYPVKVREDVLYAGEESGK